VLGNRVKAADSSLARLVGLLGRSALPDGEGLWIVPCQAIHTVGMRFVIDAVFLDKARRVVALRPSIRPFWMAMSLKAQTVLELPPRTISRSETEVGDQLEISAKVLSPPPATIPTSKL
jgi:uncharacterized protein